MRKSELPLLLFGSRWGRCDVMYDVIAGAVRLSVLLCRDTNTFVRIGMVMIELDAVGVAC